MEYYDDELDYILEDIEMYISEEDWDSVMDWAADFHDTTNPIIAEKVIDCYEMCIEHGIIEAYVNLGTFYYNGIFVPRDYKRAFELYKVAADNGLVRAICNCGYCYYYGRHQEVDYDKALEYFTKGALLYNDANCLYKIGDMYLNGLSLEQNEIYAFTLYERAFDQVKERDDNDIEGDILFRLGKCHLYGIGTYKNIYYANRLLNMALLSFYDRRETDPYVGELIKSCKKMIKEVQDILDQEII